MSSMQLPSSGQCRCGAVEFRISAPPLLTMVCHCKGCQRMSSSAYSLSAAIPTPAFEITCGEPVLGGARNPDIKHFFCPSCMTWMFSRFQPDFVNVRATLLEDTSWFTPFMETCTKTKLSWVTTPAAHSYEEFPPMEDFPKLLAEFAQTRG
jgi:hypothetical protein